MTSEGEVSSLLPRLSADKPYSIAASRGHLFSGDEAGCHPPAPEFLTANAKPIATVRGRLPGGDEGDTSRRERFCDFHSGNGVDRLATFKALDGHDAGAGRRCNVCCCPSKIGPGGTALGSGEVH